MLRLLPLLLALVCTDVCAQHGSGVYVGGHIRRERPNTITTLKNSGFTYVILFNVSVEADGTLTTDGETICKDGVYVFNRQQPHYVEDVQALKTQPTGIERIEICIGGWGNESYDRIRDLIRQQGTDSSSILYRNFKALKDKLPEIDAVNNDDEHCYDASTAVRFHAMMYDLGYLTTVAPYTNKTFWRTLVENLNTSRPSACDRVLVQCYDGGAYNNPADWQLGGLPIHAGRTNYQSDMATSVAQMQRWHDAAGVVGGFVWVYNDETWNLNQWASAMNRIFGNKQAEDPVLTLYSANSYGGYSIQLDEGEYTMAQLAARGMADKDIASFTMKAGYQLTGYANPDLTGQSREWTDEEMPRMSTWYKRISSLKVERIGGDTGIESLSPDARSHAVYYDANGMRLLHPRRGLNLVRMDDGTVRKVMVR